MSRLLLIAYEPLLFGLAVLGWAGWEFWSMRTKTGHAPKASDEAGADPPPGAAG